MRAILILGCFAASWAAAYFVEPFVAANGNALLILETVFTVFAGFLVAIITIVGDPALIPDGSWRAAEVRRDKIETSLISHMWLFILYLLAIGLIFVGVVIREIPTHIIPNVIKIWVNRAYLFCGISSFVFTFGLARSLFNLQIARIEAEISKRRKAAGIRD